MSETHAIISKTYTLSDGMVIPAVGFGAMQHGMVFPDKERPKVIETFKQAILAGYRFIDTAPGYGTEDLLGTAIRASGVPRSEFTVITKLASTHHHDPETSLRESLAKLDVGYIDIFLLHWPNASGPDGRWRNIDESPTFVEAYKMMEKLVGPECRSIGVCNFSQKTMEVLLKECTIKPVVNEIEVHPFNPNLKLVPYCLEKGIRVMSWGPLAGGPKSHYFDTSPLYNHPILTSLASRYNRGIVPIPHSASPARMDENLHPVSLTEEEVEQISNMHKQIGHRRLTDSVEFLWGDAPGKGYAIMGWTLQEMGWVDAEGNVLD
ncbi:hypothetical protein EMCG_00556 [[Emmonsia] crescens]|uniref:D-xylose reductase [NAD(P)H] n=1 Tax=[Emmonsia] crescens TaxID=73230 RepID=A0A0G2HU45_9EURO|nr:hypothetical protein EMCG_00556 [Emmonsia crescens UAMH 3008]